eukprot:COSAG05_NODE_614_length_8342_cov_5.716851_4_plen_48_part_00
MFSEGKVPESTGTAAASCTSTDLNSENNKFDHETSDLVNEYCTLATF